jgi:oligopeptide/dipeptide ABC transporter ATP-binding protein
MTDTRPLLDVQNLSAAFPLRRGLFSRTIGQIRAVDGVSFSISRGETLGLVGESGCGKTTLARTILLLEKAVGGSITFDGTDMLAASRESMCRLRRQMQVIFQDPFESLNPRMTVMEIVTEGLLTHGLIRRRDMQTAAAQLLADTGLGDEMLHRYPHEFSGGQRQRISIARAIALQPALILCDEPVSALDVSIQSQILNLLMDLRERFGLSYLFISHDLSVVRHIADRVAVMYLGRIVETGPAEGVMRHPRHPYTQALITAIPRTGGTRRDRPLRLPGDVPSPANPPPGCPFHPRCPFAQDRCRRERPLLEPCPPPPIGGMPTLPNAPHLAACFRKDEI